MKRIIILLALVVSTAAPAKDWVEMSPQEKREAVAQRVKEVLADPEMRARMEAAGETARRKLSEDWIKYRNTFK